MDQKKLNLQDLEQLGRDRIRISQNCTSPEDWSRLWTPPRYPFPFVWGDCWKQCLEYKVNNYPAEVGFLIEILGLSVNAFGPDYAMFTSPHQDFFFAVVPATDGNATANESIRIQFMVNNILELTEELEQRGVLFEHKPAPYGSKDSPMYTGSFRTPHGICVDLWGLVKS